jgi:hypothetical protein
MVLPSRDLLRVVGVREVLRFFLWRMLGLLAALVGILLLRWLIGGGPGRVLRGSDTKAFHPSVGPLAQLLGRSLGEVWSWSPALGLSPVRGLAVLLIAAAVPLALLRWRARRARRYMRLEVAPYRTDRASCEAVVTMFESLHKRVLRRWWRRLLSGQPSLR